jgi:hypothetical protein
MSYTIQFKSTYPSGSASQPGKEPIAIADNLKDDTSTSLVLCGRGYSPFGEDLWRNMVWLLENFCSSSSPANPTFGQLWYDKPNKALKIYKQTNETTDAGSWQLVGNSAGGGFHVDGTSILPDAGVEKLDLTGALLKIPNTSVTNSSVFDTYAMNRLYNDGRYIRIASPANTFSPSTVVTAAQKIRYNAAPTLDSTSANADQFTLIHKGYVDSLLGGSNGSMVPSDTNSYTGGEIGFLSSNGTTTSWVKTSTLFVTQDNYLTTTPSNLAIPSTAYKFVNGRKKFANNTKYYGGVEIMNLPLPSGANSTDTDYTSLTNKEKNDNVSRLILRTALAVGPTNGTVSMGTENDILVSQGGNFTAGTGTDYGYKAPAWKNLRSLLLIDAQSTSTTPDNAVPTLVTESGSKVVKWVVPGTGTIADGSVGVSKFTPGANNEFLSTTGGVVKWASINQLPALTGNAGFLYNTGSQATWVAAGADGTVLTSGAAGTQPTWKDLSATYIPKAGTTGIGPLSLTAHPFTLTDTSTAATSTSALNVATAGWVNSKLATFSPDNIAKLVNGLLVGGGIKALPTTNVAFDTVKGLIFKRGFLQLAGGIIIQWIESERMTHKTVYDRGELKGKDSGYGGNTAYVKTQAELIASNSVYTYYPACHHATIGKYQYAKPFAQTFISFVTTNITETTDGNEIDNYMHQAFVYQPACSNTHGSFMFRYAGDFTTGTKLYCTGTMITIGMLAEANL